VQIIKPLITAAKYRVLKITMIRFQHAGKNSYKYTVVLSFTEAWDEWNDKMLEIWDKETHNIEKFTIDSI